LLLSQRIDLDTFSELSAKQRTKLLALLDNYSDFFGNPGFVTVNQHKLDVSAVYKPPKLKVNYMLEDLKPRFTHVEFCASSKN